MTLASGNRRWVLIAVAIAAAALVIVGLRLGGRTESWPVSLGANSMERVKGKPITLYSCDNTAVLHGAPCHGPGDPDSMQVVLHDAPGGDPSLRFPDAGRGVAGTSLELRFVSGAVWVKVEVSGRKGWTLRDYTR